MPSLDWTNPYWAAVDKSPCTYSIAQPHDPQHFTVTRYGPMPTQTVLGEIDTDLASAQARAQADCDTSPEVQNSIRKS